MKPKALENAELALTQLVAFLAEPVTSHRDRAGIIQAFEFTFEATWKLLKFVAEQEGLTAESPRRALTSGYKLGLVTDDVLWLEMLRDRNLTSHVYHQQIAQRIFEAIRARYSNALAEVIRLVRASYQGA